MKVYFFSGLGADERAFINIKLNSSFEIVHIPWIVPEKNESLKSYAQRISVYIDTTNPFALVGLSFGGVVVSEMLDILKPAKTILISSVARRSELPLYFRTAGTLRLYKFSLPFPSAKANAFIYWIFGISSDENRNLFRSVLERSNPVFSQWAVARLLRWDRSLSQDNIIRIHGDQDKLLPIINFQPDYLIEGGGHLMILDRAGQISEIISNELNSVNSKN
ncbi:alpha/beta hydrolase [Pollutibacter soli]|uniref:alpha/beta hydrolase n=1 Tax=Pollutibacter soli TaxID=3034157 RepID=UPI0030131FF2